MNDRNNNNSQSSTPLRGAGGLLYTLSIILLLATMISCGDRSNQPTGDILTINVSGNFPERTMILQDFMDVEYIVLDDSDDFLTQGIVRAIGNNVILVTNWFPDGNIFVFDRNTGEGLRVINRRGQGPGEYANILQVVLDEENNEMFVWTPGRFLVYDLYGNFLRQFNFAGGSVRNADAYNFLVYRTFPISLEEHRQPVFLIISKQDGSFVEEIHIHSEAFRTPHIVENDGGAVSVIEANYPPFVPYQDGWMLVQTSSDTIFHRVPNGDLVPLIARTPPIHTTSTERFLFPGVFTDRYYFMQIHRKGMQGDTRNWVNVRAFPRVNLVYDRQENAIFEVEVLNDDFATRRIVDMGSGLISHNIAFFEVLQAYRLVEAYENGELTGRLRELASTLNEDSNPVIMLVRNRR